MHFSDKQKVADLWEAVRDDNLGLAKLIFPKATVDLEAKDENGDTLMQMMRQREALECDGHWYHGMKTFLKAKGAKSGNHIVREVLDECHLPVGVKKTGSLHDSKIMTTLAHTTFELVDK